MEKHLRARRAIAVATAAVTFASGAAMTVQASEIQRAYQQHTSTCIGLFFSDRKAHAAQCLPNNMVTEWTSTSSGGAPAAVVPPPPVVVDEPPAPPDCELAPANCGPACEQLA